MGIFQSLLNLATNAVGVDTNYRERYFQAHPEQYHKCQMCGKQLDRFSTKVDDAVTIDHIWPQKLAVKYHVLAKPLSNLLNLQVLCRSCNSKKRDRISSVNFEQSLGAILREIRSVLDDLGIHDNVRNEMEKFMND
jgi:hypothetical protein